MYLFYHPGDFASRAVWLFTLQFKEEVQVQVIGVDLTQGEQNSMLFKTVSPSGTLPALIHGNVRLFEAYVSSSFLSSHILSFLMGFVVLQWGDLSILGRVAPDALSQIPSC